MVGTIIKNDIRFMKKDPMMWGIAFMPFAMILVYMLAVRYVPYLEPYLEAFRYLLITMAGVMPGAIIGLRILDEKDEHLLPYFSVTPLTLRGYYRYRGSVSMCIGIVETIIVCMGTEAGLSFVFIIFNACLGTMMTFLVGAIAGNKVQGMVFLKLFGIVVLFPCIRLLGENRYDIIIHLLPWDYMYMGFTLDHVAINMTVLYFLYVLGVISILYRRAIRI